MVLMSRKEAMNMTIRKTLDHSALLVALEGRLDTTTAPELDETLKSSLEGVTDLTLDLEKLDYLSSAGLRVFLSAQKRMSKQGTMTVKNVNETIMEIFEITGFADILAIQ